MLARGITGFWTHGDDPPPAVDFLRFKSACFAATRELGWQVTAIKTAGVTPNFHAAQLHGSTPLWAICNNAHPIVGLLTRPPSPGSLAWGDQPALARGFEAAGFTVASATSLARSAESADLSALDPAEIEQVRYWSPSTIGEVIFHWWD